MNQEFVEYCFSRFLEKWRNLEVEGIYDEPPEDVEPWSECYYLAWWEMNHKDLMKDLSYDFAESFDTLVSVLLLTYEELNRDSNGEVEKARKKAHLPPRLKNSK